MCRAIFARPGPRCNLALPSVLLLPSHARTRSSLSKALSTPPLAAACLAHTPLLTAAQPALRPCPPAPACAGRSAAARAAPPPHELRRQAAALSGDAVSPLTLNPTPRIRTATHADVQRKGCRHSRPAQRPPAARQPLHWAASTALGFFPGAHSSFTPTVHPLTTATGHSDPRQQPPAPMTMALRPQLMLLTPAAAVIATQHASLWPERQCATWQFLQGGITLDTR
jgi:hypothetical protein